MIENHSLGIDFQKMFEPNWFKIRIMNFEHGMPINLALTFVFDDPSVLSDYQAGVVVSTENGTVDCGSGKYHDGDVKTVWSKIGVMNVLTLQQQKYTYNNQKCRNQPYSEELNHILVKALFDDCSTPCKPVDWTYICYSLGLSKKFIALPNCKTEKESECFQNVYTTSRKMVTHQPCTKLQYAVENNDFRVSMLQSQVVFQMTFASPDVTVHEEYLIYDLVAVVSAIGGTMGLCIGISFRDVSIFFAR